MDTEFWLSKWESKVIGFHLSETNPLLMEHLGRLPLPPGGRIFLPLCGKTLDIQWLLNQGYQVSGCEVSELAVKGLFQQLELQPDVTALTNGLCYSAHNLEIFVCDFFGLSTDILGHVDAVYDRAALIALPLEMRKRYANHLSVVTDSAPQLLVTLVYDQNQMAGPPFCVSDEEVRSHYGATYEPILMASSEIPGGLKGKYASLENVWLLF